MKVIIEIRVVHRGHRPVRSWSFVRVYVDGVIVAERMIYNDPSGELAQCDGLGLATKHAPGIVPAIAVHEEFIDRRSRTFRPTAWR
jgi:hypothetical protein